jgi:uncharacterized membrane protein
VLLRESVTRPAILAIVVALGGLAVLAGVGAGTGGSTAAGDLLVAGGVLSAGLYTIVAKRFDDGSDALSLTAWQFAVAALVSLLVTIARWTAGSGTATVSAAPRFWLVAMLVGAGGFGLSFLLFNMVIGQVDAGRAAVVLNLIPVFGVASAVIFLHEDVTGRDALGAALIGSSVLYFAIADHREATAPGAGGTHRADEVAEDVVAVGREDGFGMELQALGRMLGVPQSHRDSAGAPGGNQQTGRQGALIDDQGVVAPGRETPGQASQDAAAVVSDQCRLAVDGLRRRGDPGAVGRRDGLMAEADAEQRDCARAGPDGVDADTRVGGSPRAG